MRPGSSSRMRMGEICTCEMRCRARVRLFKGPPQTPALRAARSCGPRITSDRHTFTQSHTGPCPSRPRSVTACVTRPRSATRSLSHSHSPSHTRCHTQCLTLGYSVSHSALALWRHLEVLEQLGNSLSCAQGLVPQVPKCPSSI